MVQQARLSQRSAEVFHYLSSVPIGQFNQAADAEPRGFEALPALYL